MVAHAYNPRTGWRMPVSPALRHQGSRPTLGCSKFQVSFDELVSKIKIERVQSAWCILWYLTHTHRHTPVVSTREKLVTASTVSFRTIDGLV